MTKRYQYRTPNGTLIIGSKDTVPCRADINWFKADGSPEWSGDTKVFWNDQKTEKRDQQLLYLDGYGSEWLLAECKREPYKPGVK